MSYHSENCSSKLIFNEVVAIPARHVGTSVFKRLKKPKISYHNHSFSSIINPETVLEISAVPEYVGTILIRLLRKIKKSVFHDPQKGQNVHQKTIF